MDWEVKTIGIDTIQNYFISKVKFEFFKVISKTTSAIKVKFYLQGNEKALSTKSLENEVNSLQTWMERGQIASGLLILRVTSRPRCKRMSHMPFSNIPPNLNYHAGSLLLLLLASPFVSFCISVKGYI